MQLNLSSHVAPRYSALVPALECEGRAPQTDGVQPSRVHSALDAVRAWVCTWVVVARCGQGTRNAAAGASRPWRQDPPDAAEPEITVLGSSGPRSPRPCGCVSALVDEG